VVNDGTHDSAYADLAGDHESTLHYMVIDEPRGPAHARNAGARRSDAEFVIFTDDDCLPPPHWLDWILSRLETAGDIDVIGGTTVPPRLRAECTAVERFNRALHLYPRPLFFNRELYCLPTANVAVRRSKFIESGGFDETFRFAAGEDTEFFYRLRMLGAKFAIDMNWWTEHPVADSLASFLRRWYRYGYGNAQHRIRSGDPFENGVPPTLTLSKIAIGLPKYVANRRSYVSDQEAAPAGQDTPDRWERTFTPLALIQRSAYQFGGWRAYKTEGAGRAQSSVPIVGSPSSFSIPHQSFDRPIPAFGLVIGAMKCGTSALFAALRRHPSVAPSRLKEPRFFISDVEQAKGIHWYLDLFDYDPDRHKIAFEAATYNSMLPLFTGAAERMLKTGWQFRFIYLVRDPIQRIESHYLHGAVANFGLSKLSLGVDSLPIDISRYHHQLAPYKSLFGHESLLVISYDDWLGQPQQTLDKVCRHLGIQPGIIQTAPATHVSEYNYRRVLLIRELQSRGLTTARDVTIDNVLDHLSALPAADRAVIESSVDSRYRLSGVQKADIRRELATDISKLRSDYAIDVSRWGFD
jgi:hypothetical protein